MGNYYDSEIRFYTEIFSRSALQILGIVNDSNRYFDTLVEGSKPPPPLLRTLQRSPYYSARSYASTIRCTRGWRTTSAFVS